MTFLLFSRILLNCISYELVMGILLWKSEEK